MLSIVILGKREADARLFLRDYSLFNASLFFMFCDFLFCVSLREIIKNTMTPGGPKATAKKNCGKENVRNIKHANKGFDGLQLLQDISAASHYACGNLVIKQLKIVCDSTNSSASAEITQVCNIYEEKEKKETKIQE
jgi:hypothetical protein